MVDWLTQWITDSLTDSIICPHNALKNLEKVEKLYSGQTLTRSQAASHLANAPWRQQPENSWQNIWLRAIISQKPLNLIFPDLFSVSYTKLIYFITWASYCSFGSTSEEYVFDDIIVLVQGTLQPLEKLYIFFQAL